MSMTWCSEYSAVPRCLPARSAIRCRSVDRFVGFSVPSRVSLQRFSLRGASLSSVGSQRARFPDLTGTMKALRLPSQACPGPLWATAVTDLRNDCKNQSYQRVDLTVLSRLKRRSIAHFSGNTRLVSYGADRSVDM